MICNASEAVPQKSSNKAAAMQDFHPCNKSIKTLLERSCWKSSKKLLSMYLQHTDRKYYKLSHYVAQVSSSFSATECLIV